MALTHTTARHTAVRGSGRSQRRGRPVRRGAGLRIAPLFWMTMLTVFIVAVGILPAAGDPVRPPSTSAITVRVSSCDTLWTIAAQHRLPGLSTAQMVRVIRDANSLSGTLTAGAVLQIPAEAMDGTAYAQVSGVGDPN